MLRSTVSILKFPICLLTLGFLAAVADSARAESIADARTSQWDSTFEDSAHSFSVHASLSFQGNSGQFTNDDGETGSLSSLQFNSSGADVIVSGVWNMSGQAGTFRFDINGNGSQFSGTWSNQSNGQNGTWEGSRVGGGNSNPGGSGNNSGGSVLNGTQWQSTFQDSQHTFSVQATITFNGNSGQYVTDDGRTGQLENLNFTSGGAHILVVNGTWILADQNGTFTLDINTAANSFTGQWTNNSDGSTGTWNGSRSGGGHDGGDHGGNGLPDPDATPLPKPTLGARNDAEYIKRHALAVANALQALAGPDCKISLLGFNSSYNPGTANYNVYIRTAKNGQQKDIHSQANGGSLPSQAAQGLAVSLAGAGSLCAFKSPAEVTAAKAQAASAAVQAAKTNLQAMLQTAANGSGKDRLNSPTIVVTGNQVVIVDPMDSDKQQQILQQMDQGVPENSTDDGPSGPQTRTQTFGDPNLIALSIDASVTRPDSHFNAQANAELSATFVNNKQSLLRGNVQTFLTGEGSREGSPVVHLQGSLSMMTPHGFQVLKTIDESRSTTFEQPGDILLDDVVLFEYPPECVPTPIGPACIEGSIVASAGYKPYGVQLAPPILAYFRPYADVALQVFGGLEYEVARSGIRGDVSILNGTLALLVGDVNNRGNQACATAQLDELDILDGKIFADVEVDLGAIAGTDDIPQQVGDLCQQAKDAGAQVIDYGKNVVDGIITDSGAQDAIDTASQAADQVQQAAAAGKDAVSTVSNVVSNPVGAVSGALGGGGFGLTDGGGTWANGVKNLEQTDCDTVTQKLNDLQQLRYLKELFHWDGVPLEKHHKWLNACSN